MAGKYEYEGVYEVTPKLYEKTILPTADKNLLEDIRVTKIPYKEVSNLGGGETLIIGGD